MDRELTSFDYRRVIDTIRRANAIAANNDLDALLDQLSGAGLNVVRALDEDPDVRTAEEG